MDKKILRWGNGNIIIRSPEIINCEDCNDMKGNVYEVCPEHMAKLMLGKIKYSFIEINKK